MDNRSSSDFAAAEKMVNSSRQKLLASIQYKIIAKPNNTDSFTHPSWIHRKEYVENYDFEDNLIHRIANDAKCVNDELIRKVKDYYRTIVLAKEKF